MNINQHLKLKLIQNFLKSNESTFDEFRKKLLKFGFSATTVYFNDGHKDIKLFFESREIDNYFVHKPNEYEVSVFVGSFTKSHKIEILKVQTRNGLDKQTLNDNIVKLLLKGFDK